MRNPGSIVLAAALMFSALACSSGGSDGSSSGSSGTSGSTGSLNGSGSTGGSTGSTGADPCSYGAGHYAQPGQDRAHATAISVDGNVINGCINQGDGINATNDFYEVTAPSDGTGGYYDVSLTDTDGTLDLHAYGASDFAELLDAYASNIGETVSAHFAAAPGSSYFINVASFSSAAGTFKYAMTVAYHPIADPNAANRTLATAKQIALGIATPGYFFTGTVSGAAPTADSYSDYFELSAVAGSTITATVANVATNVYGDADILDSNHAVIGSGYSSNLGAGFTAVSSQLATSGTFYVRVYAFTLPTNVNGADPLPDSFTTPYALTVTQP